MGPLCSELALFGLSVVNDVEDDLVAKGFLGVHDASSSLDTSANSRSQRHKNSVSLLQSLKNAAF